MVLSEWNVLRRPRRSDRQDPALQRPVAPGRRQGDPAICCRTGLTMLDSHPVVYTIREGDACVKLLKKWDAEGVAYLDRVTDLAHIIETGHNSYRFKRTALKRQPASK